MSKPSSQLDRRGATRCVPTTDAARARQTGLSTASRAGTVHDHARLQHRLTRQTAVLQSVIDFQSQSTLSAALIALASGLKTRFRCSRVVVGLWRGDRAEVAAISQQADVDRRAAETRLLEAALTEATLHDRFLCIGDDDDVSVPAVARLLLGRPDSCIATVPLCCNETQIGVLLLESAADGRWSAERRSLVQQLADLLAPMIETRRAADRSAIERLRESLRHTQATLTAPRRLVAKLGVLVVILGLGLLAFVPVAHRIGAPAELVAVQLRTLAAPIDGLVRDVRVRAGDTVDAGEVLVALDTRALELERSRIEGERELLHSELRSVRALGERKQSLVLQARRDQITAELAIIEQQIERARVHAPHEGLVVSTDLDQLVGAPVERGQTLVELAKGARYIVNLYVRDVDIGHVREGQTGKLMLNADPGRSLDIDVRRIHPIAMTHDRTNRFRVEAELREPSTELRPGQAGIAKLEVGRTTALWSLLDEFVRWTRLRIWAWFG